MLSPGAHAPGLLDCRGEVVHPAHLCRGSVRTREYRATLFAMEAATPLPTPASASWATACASTASSSPTSAPSAWPASAEAGEDPAAVVADAIEIGARVLDREQTGVQADFVKAEFERAARSVEASFSDQAQRAAVGCAGSLEAVFGPDSGHLTKALERQSLRREQRRGAAPGPRQVLTEAMGKSREDLVRQFSSSDGSNPLAGFQRAALHSIKTASDQQHAHLREMNGTIVALREEPGGPAGREGGSSRRSPRRPRRAPRRAAPTRRRSPPRSTRLRCRWATTPRPSAISASRRQEGRRRRVDRRLRRPGAGARRLRGQGPAAEPPRRAAGAWTPAWPSATRLRRARRPDA